MWNHRNIEDRVMRIIVKHSDGTIVNGDLDGIHGHRRYHFFESDDEVYIHIECHESDNWKYLLDDPLPEAFDIRHQMVKTLCGGT